MTKVDFKLYSAENAGEQVQLEDLGTLNSQIGVGGTYRPSSRANFLSEKRVAIVATNKKGESAVISCSEAVSKGLRAKTIKFSELGQYHLVANEQGIVFISAGSMPTVEVKSVKEEPVAVTANSLADLIAW